MWCKMTLLINDLESKLAEKTIMNLFSDVVVEYFDGTGLDNQTNTLHYHAFSPLISVAVKNTKWEEKTEVTSLSSSDHVKFDPSSDDQLIMWGDGTNGAKPPSGTNNIRIIYRKKTSSIDSLNDDTVKGLLRSIGDAGSSPTNVTGETVLKKLDDILTDTVLSSGDNTIGRVKITDGVEVVNVNTNNRLETVISEPLPTGTNTIGKLASNSGVDIGDVDVTSLPSFDTATPTKVSVGSTSTTVLSANANRNFAVFVNDSDTAIYLSFSSTAVLNEGIRLNANGGLYEINLMNLYKGPVTAICSVAGKNLTVTEG